MYRTYCTAGGTMGRKYVYTGESNPQATQSAHQIFWIRPSAIYLLGTKQMRA
jgi:hypothetical protein